METQPRRSTLHTAFVATIASAAFLLIASTTSVGQVTTLFTASAYGASASTGTVIVVAPTALSQVGAGCGIPVLGVHQSNTLTSVSDPPLLQTGLTNSLAETYQPPQSASSNADIQQINLLAGLISGQEVQAVSTSYVGADHGIHVTAAGSNFVHLSVAGIPINGLPAPNTTIPLLGLGRVVLNEQVTSLQPLSAKLAVNMIHIYITLPNLLGIPLNTEIIVGNAISGVAEYSTPAVMGGTAFGTSISGGVLQSSPTAQVTVPCSGTGGRLITDTQATVNIPSVLSSGTVIDTAEGILTETLVSAQTTSSVQGLNLLAGLVTAGLIQDQANSSTPNGSNYSFSSSGTFTNLRVAGYPGIGDNVPPNTTIPIPGLGILYLHRVITTSDSIEVTMIELVISQSNLLGLPIGTDIKIADAEASLHSAQRP
jgi:hypothetical protein